MCRGIQTITVKTTVVPNYLELAAHIEADPTRVVHVFAPAGGRITELKVRPWERVEKGQTLALLESSDLARAMADYQRGVADNEVKQKQLARAQDLHSPPTQSRKKTFSKRRQTRRWQRPFWRPRENKFSYLAWIPIRRAHSYASQRRAPARCSTSMPLRVSSPKSLDAPMPLCTIADITTVWALGDVFEKDLSAVKSGQEATVTLNAYPGENWKGQISVVSDTVDPVTRTLHVRAILPNSNMRIKPAMFGSIRILRSNSQGILVPTSAVIREGNAAYIFVDKGNGKYERRNVKLARSFDGSLEIASGISAGDTIVSEGGAVLPARRRSGLAADAQPDPPRSSGIGR